MSLLVSLDFASYYVWSQQGADGLSAPGLAIFDGLKEAEPKALEGIAKRVREALFNDGFAEFLGHGVAVIPVPPHEPRGNLAGPWPARSICDALLSAGLAAEVMPYLKRTSAVAAACRNARAELPSAREQFGSMAMIDKLTVHDRITVVDDVVTTGATLFAAASRVRLAYPHAEVRAFAALRIAEPTPTPEDAHSPTCGQLRLVGGKDVELVL